MTEASHPHIPDDTSEAALRTKALESLLIEKGILTTDVLDAVVHTYENDSNSRSPSKSSIHRAFPLVFS